MFKSLLVVLLVLSGLNFALAGDWRILTNGSEYRVYKESPSFTATPYTIQDGLKLTKKEIDDFMANKKDVYDLKTGEIIHSVFNKWYTHETITREYQGYGLKDTRIVRKLFNEEVEVLNPVLYFVILSLLLLVISTEFKSKYLRLADDDRHASFSENEWVKDRKEASFFCDASLLLAALVTLVAIGVNLFSTHALLFAVAMSVCVVVNLIWSALSEESLAPNFVGVTILAIVGLAILF